MSVLSTIDSRITLEFLRENREDQYFERKGIEELGMKPTKLANEIIGMLNADGGVIVLGISNEGTIQNLHSLDPDIIDQYRKVCFDFIAPPANVYIEEITLSTGELIFLYHIDQDYERVFARKDNEAVYLRVSDSNKGPLARDAVRKLDYDKGIQKFEDELREDFDESDFRDSVLEFYREKMKFSGNYQDLLVKRNLAVRKQDRVIYKNSAILLFAEDPDTYIPSAWVRYVRYSGIDALTAINFNVVKDEEFRGPIPRLIEILKRFIYASLRDYYYFDLQNGKFIKISEYPQEAWLEGIINALCHRSYNIQGNPIYIKHFDDRIEISNSGPLPAQVTIDTIRTERFSRNPRVARVLADMGYVRELNEGVKRIYESMEKSLLAKPEYIDTNNMVTLILRNKIANHDSTISEATMLKIENIFPKLNPTEILVVQYLFDYHQATISDFLQHIDKTEPAIRGAINKLIDLAIVSKKTDKQRDKNAIYVFKKS